MQSKSTLVKLSLDCEAAFNASHIAGILKVLSAKFLYRPDNINTKIIVKACFELILLQVKPLNLKEGPVYDLPFIIFVLLCEYPNISTKEIAGGISYISSQEPEALLTW